MMNRSIGSFQLADPNIGNEIAQFDTFGTLVCVLPLFWPTIVPFYPIFERFLSAASRKSRKAASFYNLRRQSGQCWHFLNNLLLILSRTNNLGYRVLIFKSMYSNSGMSLVDGAMMSATHFSTTTISSFSLTRKLWKNGLPGSLCHIFPTLRTRASNYSVCQD